MKALSIRQPWAWLILHAGKDIENRTWYTRFRGPVLIHAAKGMTGQEWLDSWSFAKRAIAPKRLPAVREISDQLRLGSIDRGGIVGMVDIVDCVQRSDSPWFVGTHGFVLANPRPVEFVPFKGQLGFFNVPDEIVRSLVFTDEGDHGKVY